MNMILFTSLYAFLASIFRNLHKKMILLPQRKNITTVTDVILDCSLTQGKRAY